MLDRIARLAMAAPRRIIAPAALIIVAAGVFGFGVTESLSAGGPVIRPVSHPARPGYYPEKFGQSDMQMTIAVTSDEGGQSPGARSVATELIDRLRGLSYVAGGSSAWDASPTAVALMSKDGKTGLIVAGINGGENGA